MVVCTLPADKINDRYMYGRDKLRGKRVEKAERAKNETASSACAEVRNGVHNLESRRWLSRFFAGVAYTPPANPGEMVVCTPSVDKINDRYMYGRDKLRGKKGEKAERAKDGTASRA